MLDFLLDLIYPRVCGFCGKIDNGYLCQSCEEKIQELIEYQIENIYDKHFDKHINIAKYDDIIRNALLSYKFNGNAYLYKTFSKIIIKNEKICEIIRKL